MIFEFREITCIFEVLKILSKGKSKYSFMFKATKVSHTTLQSVLRDLVNNKLIIKENKGHKNVDYNMTNKGKKLLDILYQLKLVLK